MKEENIKGEYQRKVDKSLIPTCNIMGVNIAAINMNWLLKYIDENLSDIKGDYICVSNVHTRDNGVIRKLAAYVILGINTEGKKEVLTISVGDNDSGVRYSKAGIKVL